MGEQGGLLVVEDDETVLQALSRIMNGYGEPVFAGTVREARALLAGPIAWRGFVIDIGLPDGSGLDLLAEARRLFPEAPAMVLTGHTTGPEINTACELGASYLVKPASTAAIRRFIGSTALSARPVIAEKAEFSSRVADAVRNIADATGLSKAETDILRRAALGESRADIAQSRDSSGLTINKHVTNLLGRTGDASLHHAVERVLREVSGAVRF